jgi:hypothetical protein
MASLDFSLSAQTPDNVSPISGTELLFGSPSRTGMPVVYKFPFTTSGVVNPVISMYGAIVGRNNFSVTDGTVTNIKVLTDYVGINTSNPASTLHVVKNGLYSGDLVTFQNTSNTNTNGLNFGMSHGSSSLLVSASYTLFNNAYVASGAFKPNSLSIGTTGANGISLVASNAAGFLSVFTGGSANANEALRVFTSGNISVGYGAAAFTDNGFNLDVLGTVKFGRTTLTSSIDHAPTISLASAATVNIGVATSNTINITGTATITAFDTVPSGIRRTLLFSTALTLTNNVTSLILPASANITTVAGDVAEMMSLGGGNWKCTEYIRFTGNNVSVTPIALGGTAATTAPNALVNLGALPTAGGTMTGAFNLALAANIPSSTTINLTNSTGNVVDITGTTGITGITLVAGANRMVRFTGILTLTNSSTLVLPGNSDITTAVGDMAVFVGYSGGIVRCASYTAINSAPSTGAVTISGVAFYLASL